MNQSNVLIVDDDPALLQALRETLRLRMEDVRVDIADSGRAALDLITTMDHDAIVTDIKMPGMDGLALLAEIRTRRPDTPTLMITGHGTMRWRLMPCAAARTTSFRSQSTGNISLRRCAGRSR